MKSLILFSFIFLSIHAAFAQAHIPKIPKSSLYKNRYLMDSTDCRIKDFGRWIVMCDSCTTHPEHLEFDRAYYRLQVSTYKNVIDVIQELDGIISFYKTKLGLPKDIRYDKPNEIGGDKWLLDKAYYSAMDEKTFNNLAQRSYMYARYDLIPNRLTIHYMFSGLAIEFFVVDSNKFK